MAASGVLYFFLPVILKKHPATRKFINDFRGHYDGPLFENNVVFENEFKVPPQKVFHFTAAADENYRFFALTVSRETLSEHMTSITP